MPNPYRILALGVLAAVGVAGVGSFVPVPSRGKPAPAPPPLLPAAHANPAKVSHADTLRRGETISELLERMRISQEEARTILRDLLEQQDPRALRAGVVVEYTTGFQDGRVRGMEMGLDPDHVLRVQRDGTELVTRVEEVLVRLDTVVLAGRVEGSLYQTLMRDPVENVSRGERERIVDRIADRIFAWKIDFSRDLQPGDEYGIVYERLARPDGTARDSRLLGVRFNLSGTEHEAYLFRTADGSTDYYDGDGESLRRAFLRAPLEFRRISSSYSNARFHPILGRWRAHRGIDYAASAGTPIRAVGDGVVARASLAGGYGKVVEIRHKRGYTSRYAHMRGFSKGIRPGVRVKQGEVIGYVGSTGLATGPHLHYEFHMGGRPVNPASIKYLTGDPIPSRQLAHFRGIVRRQVAMMRKRGEVQLASRNEQGPSSRKGAD
jgi:murein DD-endopeptidase MepM/ murein hydrolase activator NlpD